jgi:hypothetical protein
MYDYYNIILIGCVILCLFIVAYMGILAIMYWKKNPIEELHMVKSKHEMENFPPENLGKEDFVLSNYEMGEKLPSTADLTTGCNFVASIADSLNLRSNFVATRSWRGQSPLYQEYTELHNLSSVTHTFLGTRGDMGNQIFQLACIIAAGRRSNANIIFPTRISTLPIIKLFDLTHFEWKDISVDATFHEYDNYEHIVIPQDGRNYDVRGYRQSYKYFDVIGKDIRDIFVPKNEILDSIRSLIPNEYITIHIRKGDYMKFMHKIPLLREFRQCQLEYYKAGIRKLRETYPNCPLLVCTDSPQWIKPLLSELDSKAILAPIPIGIEPKFSDFCTLYLSSGIVISNSTYSWWAAYLNPDKIIICPSPWWDPDGFVGSALGLDGPYLHYPNWWLLDTDTGNIIREPHGKDKVDTSSDTLNLYKLVRGMLV